VAVLVPKYQGSHRSPVQEVLELELLGQKRPMRFPRHCELAYHLGIKFPLNMMVRW
jgi:hypothetical protein